MTVGKGAERSSNAITNSRPSVGGFSLHGKQLKASSHAHPDILRSLDVAVRAATKIFPLKAATRAPAEAANAAQAE